MQEEARRLSPCFIASGSLGKLLHHHFNDVFAYDLLLVNFSCSSISERAAPPRRLLERWPWGGARGRSSKEGRFAALLERTITMSFATSALRTTKQAPKLARSVHTSKQTLGGYDVGLHHST
jgi:hypothetical protein